jgi:hypothetical protein
MTATTVAGALFLVLGGGGGGGQGRNLTSNGPGASATPSSSSELRGDCVPLPDLARGAEEEWSRL